MPIPQAFKPQRGDRCIAGDNKNMKQPFFSDQIALSPIIQTSPIRNPVVTKKIHAKLTAKNH
jgi:hypothetical protein